MNISKLIFLLPAQPDQCFAWARRLAGIIAVVLVTFLITAQVWQDFAWARVVRREKSELSQIST